MKYVYVFWLMAIVWIVLIANAVLAVTHVYGEQTQLTVALAAAGFVAGAVGEQFRRMLADKQVIIRTLRENVAYGQNLLAKPDSDMPDEAREVVARKVWETEQHLLMLAPPKGRRRRFFRRDRTTIEKQ